MVRGRGGRENTHLRSPASRRRPAGLAHKVVAPRCYRLSPLTFDPGLDNIFENASVIEQPLGQQPHGVHGPRLQPVDHVEALRRVYGLRYPPVTVAWHGKWHQQRRQRAKDKRGQVKKVSRVRNVIRATDRSQAHTWNVSKGG